MEQQTEQQIFDAQIEEKVEALTKIHGAVVPIIFIDEKTNEKVVGYLKQLPRDAKLRIMDRALIDPYSSCGAVLEYYLIKEESDKRILEDDVFFIGAVNELYKMVSISVNQFKKK